MPKAKKIFDPLGNETTCFRADDLKGIMDFAARSGIDAHDLIGFGEVGKDEHGSPVITFTASYGQRKDGPPFGLCRKETNLNTDRK